MLPHVAFHAEADPLVCHYVACAGATAEDLDCLNGARCTQMLSLNIGMENQVK